MRLAITVGLLTISTAAHAQLYVTATGNDANACTQAAPCRQIRKAVTLANPGTVINVADGSYLGFDISQKTGITVKATGTGAVVTTTSDRPDNRDTILIRASSANTVIDGLRSNNAVRAALRVDTSHNVTIKNCVFWNNAVWGIFTNHSDDLIIENNETYGSVAEHGIYVSNSAKRPTIRGNKVHDNKGNGIHVNADVSAGGDGIISGALIENNVVWNNGTSGGSAINMDGVIDSTVRNNLIYDNKATGIGFYRIDGAVGPRNNHVYHNTVVQLSTSRQALLVWETTGPMTVRDNIFYHPSASSKGSIVYFAQSDVNNTTSTNNVGSHFSPDDGATFYTLAQWQGQGKEAGSIDSNPTALFVGGGNYHLKAGSPAIDKGQTIPAVTVDIEGAPRPQGSASDIGAYEFGGQTPPPTGSVRATLTWADNSNNEAGFRIERRDSGSYAQVGEVGQNISTWSQTGLTTGVTYCYRVAAYNASGTAPYSNESCGMVPAPTPTPTPGPSPTPTPQAPPSAASGLSAVFELLPATRRP